MATPTEHGWRSYAAYIRGPAGFNTYAFTSTSDPSISVRGGVAHSPQIVSAPTPADTAPDDFGILSPGNFDVEIFDEQSDDDWPLLDSSGNFLLQDDADLQLVQDF